MAHNIQPFAPFHARAIALLHQRCIRTGFLSRLGVGFLTKLYKSIGRSPHSRVFVAVDPGSQKVAGFAACSLDTAAMYRHILLRQGLFFFFLLLPRAFSPRNLAYIRETLAYPHKARPKGSAAPGADVQPAAELLSIAVSDDNRGKGVGRQLLAALESYLRENGVTSYKTVTFSSDCDSNAFYAKCGFVLQKQVVHHGNVLNQYVKSICPN